MYTLKSPSHTLGSAVILLINQARLPILVRVLAVWSLLTVIVAVRQGLDISTRWAALICLVGWPLIQVAIGFVQVFEQTFLKGI